MAEVVEHEKNGLLFEAGDIAGLSTAIERLAGDRATIAAVGSKCNNAKIDFRLRERIANYLR